MATLGGLNGFFGLCMQIMGPVFALMFLAWLSRIIIKIYDDKYREELIKILKNLYHCNLDKCQDL